MEKRKVKKKKWKGKRRGDSNGVQRATGSYTVMSKSQKSDSEGRKGIKGLGNSRNSVDGWAERLLNSDQGGRGLVGAAGAPRFTVRASNNDSARRPRQGTDGNASLGRDGGRDMRVGDECSGLGSPSTSTRGFLHACG